MRRLVEIIAVLLVGGFLFLALHGEHPGESETKTLIVENGQDDTGARNLVTAVYLGYRAFDTFGETIVLLMAVSGVIYLTAGREQE